MRKRRVGKKAAANPLAKAYGKSAKKVSKRSSSKASSYKKKSGGGGKPGKKGKG